MWRGFQVRSCPPSHLVGHVFDVVVVTVVVFLVGGDDGGGGGVVWLLLLALLALLVSRVSNYAFS